MTKPSRGVVSFLWRPLLVLAVVAALAYWFLTSWPTTQDRTPVPEQPTAEATKAAAPWRPRPRERVPAPGCRPQAQRRCIAGDVWWFDGCGQPHDKADECGLARCTEDACEAAVDRDCVGAAETGRCVHEVAIGCSAGERYEVDCKKQDRRCVLTDEGPTCREVTEHDCDDPPGSARCEKNELVTCIDGREIRFECAAVGGVCAPGRGGTQMRCVTAGPLPGEEDCGDCGCDAEPRDEICDGKDNDGDDVVDEDAECGEIDLLAVVVLDDDSKTSYTDSDLEAELERVNAAFARDDGLGLSFRFADIIWLIAPELAEITPDELQVLINTRRVAPEREDFYVPVLFTDELLVDEVPRPGLATPPNGACGGQRRTFDPQSPIGVVAIAKRRYPSTVAHEIGHYLGLCHTHMPDPAAVERLGCEEDCELSGDGICDTPHDPGPVQCDVDDACSIHCATGDRPEPINIMAYYPPCRSAFSREQALVMRQALALRRGWRPCLQGQGCQCDPIKKDCPEQMTCREVAGDQGWRCGLDGAVLAGGVCRSPIDCAGGTQCVRGPGPQPLCVRPCDPQTASCECREVTGFDVPLCLDDLG